jgi:hypothetical protein
MSKKQLILDYQGIFGGESGKNVLEDLKKHCPTLLDSIDSSKGIDVNQLLYREGQRSVLLYIFKMLKADPYKEVQLRAEKES